MAAVPYHVAQSFVAGRKDSAGSFVTDGRAIYSYAMRLAHKEGSDIVYDYKPLAHGNSAPSVSTARHMRALEYTCPPPGPIAIRRNPTAASTGKRYKVEHLFSYGWDDADWGDTDAEGERTPVTFATREAAQREINDLVQEFDDYDVEDYRVVEVRNNPARCLSRRNPAGRHHKVAAPLVGWPFIKRGDTFRFTLGGTKGAEYEITTTPTSSGTTGGGLTYFAPGSDFGETIASDAWHAWKLVAAAIKHANKFHSDLVAQASEADGYFKNRWQMEGNTTLLPDTIRYNPAMSTPVKAAIGVGLLAAIGGAAWYFTKDKKTA